jgi:arsenite methyltransferase
VIKLRRCRITDSGECADEAQPTQEAEPETVVPEAAVAAALGCADPNKLVQIEQDETVLDVGSGSCGDIKVLISEAGRVGPHGLVYGLATGNGDERARVEAEAPNVRFVEGRVEEVPLADASVDVVVSNCLVCLSADKQNVIDESYRLLRSGGRLGLADIVTLGDVPESVRNATGVIGSALDAEDYKARIRASGFADAEIEVVRPFSRADLALVAPMVGDGLGQCPEEDLQAADGKVAGAFVRARKAA